jgi:flagellar motility protein MotE (MotC chaperone)
MTTLNWVKRNIEFALGHDETLEELRISLQSIVTRLNISPLKNEKEGKMNEEESELRAAITKAQEDSHWKGDWQKLNKHMEEKLALLINKEARIKELEKKIKLAEATRDDALGYAKGYKVRAEELGKELHKLIEGIMKADLSGVCTSTADMPYILTNDNPFSDYFNDPSWRKK